MGSYSELTWPWSLRRDLASSARCGPELSLMGVGRGECHLIESSWLTGKGRGNTLLRVVPLGPCSALSNLGPQAVCVGHWVTPVGEAPSVIRLQDLQCPLEPSGILITLEF